jgi:tetratricopeptide (TPR) repeat protein
MPTRRTCQWLLRACAAARRGAVVGALLLLAAGAGCRALHCPRDSDDSIAVARQLALQGMAAREHGRWDQAEALYAQAVQQCPRDERARCGYAESLWQRGELDQAVAHMEEAVRLSGHDPERSVQLGNMYLSRGELSRAALQAERAIDSKGQLASAWALRGKVLKAQGSRTEALASFHRALSIQQHYPEVQLALAEIYSAQGRPLRALATTQCLADSYPPGGAPTELLVHQGLALRQLGRHQDAARTLAQAALRGNPSVDLLYELARTQIMAGDAAAARLAVSAALALDPDHAGCQALRDDLAIRHGVVAATAMR